MADEQPPTVHEGATTDPPQSAEDRKAASALASLDTPGDDTTTSSSSTLDHDAASKAIKSLKPGATTLPSRPAASHRNVKVDAADVALLVEELEVSKVRATEMLRGVGGDVGKAMEAFLGV